MTDDMHDDLFDDAMRRAANQSGVTSGQLAHIEWMARQVGRATGYNPSVAARDMLDAALAYRDQTNTPHDCRVFDPDCFRCDLSRTEQ